MNGSFSLIRTTVVFGVMWSAFGCGEEATETARQCAQSNLIEQCPIGSTPGNASATSRCAGQANGSILEENGQVVGGCQAVGECTVFCRFSNPCGALHCSIRQVILFVTNNKDHVRMTCANRYRRSRRAIPMPS